MVIEYVLIVSLLLAALAWARGYDWIHSRPGRRPRSSPRTLDLTPLAVKDRER